jgi:hypothetical protein
MNPSSSLPAAALGVLLALPLSAAQLSRMSHDRDQPAPPVVVPGQPSRGDHVGSAPSDAVVLFDGTNLDAWVAMDGSPTRWVMRDGALECVPESGYVRTLQAFGDCQLHVEWAAPVPVKGSSQGRGNSGVFFGLTRYEVQVLDSYQNHTYADGSAGSVYGQYAPLVNAMRPPGEWQTYDILYTAPRFEADGALRSPARLTVFHNGVLIQRDVPLTGPTTWIGRPPYHSHPVKLPISFQDHGNPVRFRNIWVRELDTESRPEFFLPDALLNRYAGTYQFKDGDRKATVSRLPHGLLSLEFSGFQLTLYAGSRTEFFAKDTDVRCEFREVGGELKLFISVGDGAMETTKVQ